MAVRVWDERRSYRVKRGDFEVGLGEARKRRRRRRTREKERIYEGTSIRMENMGIEGRVWQTTSTVSAVVANWVRARR